MQNVPYTTKTGVQIGKYYQRPMRIEDDPDMLYWQSILLNQQTPLRTLVLRFVYVSMLFVGLILLLANNKF